MHHRPPRSLNFEAIHASSEAMDSWAEEFVFGRLSASDLDNYEPHLLTCERCRQAVKTTGEFIRRLREASAEMEE